MYIYHALINAISARMICINLNMIFYTHVQHSPTKTIYIKHYFIFLNALHTHTHTYTHTHTHTHTHIHTHTHTHTHTHARTHARTHAHTHTHNGCSRNWVQILVRMEILCPFFFLLPLLLLLSSSSYSLLLLLLLLVLLLSLFYMSVVSIHHNIVLHNPKTNELFFFLRGQGGYRCHFSLSLYVCMCDPYKNICLEKRRC